MAPREGLRLDLETGVECAGAVFGGGRDRTCGDPVWSKKGAGCECRFHGSPCQLWVWWFPNAR